MTTIVPVEIDDADQVGRAVDDAAVQLLALLQRRVEAGVLERERGELREALDERHLRRAERLPASA